MFSIQTINIPTPTPFPTPNSDLLQVEIPEMNLWTFAPDAIQAWNTADPYTEVFKLIIVVGIVVGGILLLVAMSNAITKAD